MTRCKFKCHQVTEYDLMYTYHMQPVYDSPENQEFWQATPAGSFQVSIGKSKGKLFEVGKFYFIDISEVA